MSWGPFFPHANYYLHSSDPRYTPFEPYFALHAGHVPHVKYMLARGRWDTPDLRPDRGSNMTQHACYHVDVRPSVDPLVCCGGREASDPMVTRLAGFLLLVTIYHCFFSYASEPFLPDNTWSRPGFACELCIYI